MGHRIDWKGTPREAVMVLLAPMTTARVLRDAEGCTPYDYARERDLATLLRQYADLEDELEEACGAAVLDRRLVLRRES